MRLLRMYVMKAVYLKSGTEGKSKIKNRGRILCDPAVFSRAPQNSVILSSFFFQ